MINKNLYCLFHKVIEERRDAVFLTHEKGTTTYDDLQHNVALFATVLKDCGILSGDRVMVQANKSQEYVFLYLACLQVGAVFIPLNTAYSSHEVQYFLEDAEPKLFVCVASAPELFLDAIRSVFSSAILSLGAHGDGTFMERALKASPCKSIVHRSGDDLAAILYTSGTTGKSKGSMLTHDNLSSNAISLIELWRFSQDDVLIHALPIYHVHGLFVALHCTLLSGAHALFQSQFDVQAIIKVLPDATVMMGVPTFYTRLLQQAELNEHLCSNIRLFISGSAPLNEETFEKFFKNTDHRILERYGMTETGMITSNPYDGERVPGTVGMPLPDVELRISDSKTGQKLPQGKVGVIEVRGPNVFKGYWRKQKKTDEEIRADGFFITGDLGLIDENGYTHIVGRNKDLIISGGLNVYPKEIETELNSLNGVFESAVIGVPHPDFGEGVIAVLVLDEDFELNITEITKSLSERLAKYKQPKQLMVTNELPRNAMGKVQKNIMRDTYADAFANADNLPIISGGDRK